MKAILDHRESSAQSQSLKSLAFSVFTSCRWNLTHAIMGRSLTGFGPAASAEQFLKNKVVGMCFGCFLLFLIFFPLEAHTILHTKRKIISNFLPETTIANSFGVSQWP